MGDYGGKITRAGVSVTSTDLRDYVLHSKYKSFKSKARATDTIVLNSGTSSATKTIAHGLGYSPLFFVAAEMNTDKWYNLHAIQTIPIDSDPGFSYAISAYTNATNLVISMSCPGKTFGTNQTYNITYFIIIDEVI